MGVTDKTAAALNFTLRKSGTATDVLTRGMTILEKGLVKADGTLDTTGKALKTWGINVLDVNGKLKDQGVLINDISERYSQFSTQQEKVNFLTEVFGKSGANLIDFFDTLAQEGGIDAVTKKVEAFGLAIDPNRYEQFSRSLEELKLIGLGLAVQFTEKVMPVLEKFLGWFTTFAQNPDPKKALHDIDNFISGILDEMLAQVDVWLANGGPEELSDKVISWIDDLGTGPDTSIRSISAAQRLFDALVKAFKEIDWSGIGTAIDEKITDAINSLDWAGAGDTFGTSLGTALTGEIPVMMVNQQPAAVTAIGQGITNWFIAAAGPGNIAAFDALEDAITANIRTALLGSFGKISNQFSGPQQTFMNIGYAMVNSLTAGFLGTIGNFYAAVYQFGVSLDPKLREIAKTFFNRALHWTQQMIAGFKSGLGGLLGAISSMVGEINAILKKIITSFTISLKLPSILGGGSTSTGTTGGSSTGTIGGGAGTPKPKPKASGGAVIAGQDYIVGEFGPERFVPDRNGRIEQVGSGSNEVTLSDASINKLAERLGIVIPSATIKAINNA
jgi:hypothetical protein